MKSMTSEALIGFAAKLVQLTQLDSYPPIKRTMLVNLSHKLVMHLATIHHLIDMTPLKFDGVDWKYPDISSIHSLVRIALENYAQLYEVFFEEVSEDISNYRFYAYCINSFQFNRKKGKYQNLDEGTKKFVQEFRDEIKKTHFYRKLKSKDQAETLEAGTCFIERDSKIFMRRPVVTLKDAGFHEDFAQNLIQMGHSNIHTDIFSGGQLALFNRGERPYINSGEFDSALIFIAAKFISEYVKKFPEVREFWDGYPKVVSYINMAIGVLSKNTEGSTDSES